WWAGCHVAAGAQCGERHRGPEGVRAGDGEGLPCGQEERPAHQGQIDRAGRHRGGVRCRTHTLTHTHSHTLIDTHTHTHTLTHTYTHTHTHIHTHTQVKFGNRCHMC